MKALPGKTTKDGERLAHLEAYLRACLGQSILRPSDLNLFNGNVKDRLVHMFLKDMAAIADDYKRRGIAFFGFLWNTFGATGR